MSNLNRPYWYELMTTDTDAAVRFYGAVVGFTAEAWPDPQVPYTLWMTPSGPPSGGVSPLTEEMTQAGLPPHWSGVVAVADADAVAARAVALGGAVLSPPMDVPGVGRYATLADPQGASFGVMQSATEEGPSAPPGAIGTVGWNELWTSDPEAAVAFYRALLGWRSVGAMDMGPAGTYHMLAPEGEEAPGVGIARLMEGQQRPAWLYYFVVASADASVAMVTAAGGKALMPVIDVPDGGRACVFADDQGASFGLLSR
ncbi:MAG: VOC family protein [Myxococcota bacterium]